MPRQNGKTLLLETRIHTGVALGEKILYTAHDYSTVTQLFDRMKMIYGEKANDPDAQYQEFNELVSSVRKGTGKEAIFFKNGAIVYFSTRTKSAKRGFTVDIVIADEAQELNEAHLKAMLSTASAGPRKNPQYIYTGTPPTPEASGTFFQDLHNRVHSGEDAELCWHEWAVSVESYSDLDDACDDVDWWYKTNPALGIRLDVQTIRTERNTYSENLSFAQERLGFFLMGNSVEHVINSDDWNACATENPPEDSVMYLGVKFDSDGSYYALSVCLKPENRKPYVECISYASMSHGVNSLAQWIFERSDRIAAVAIDGKTGKDALISELRGLNFPRRGIPDVSTSNFLSSVSMLVNAVHSHEIEHFAQQALDASATLTGKRRIGKDGIGFQSTEDGDAVLIESCALAYWQAMTCKRIPGRKARLL